MNATKFDEIVKNRANQRVQEKIKIFKRTVMGALKDLYGPHVHGNLHDILHNQKMNLPGFWLKALNVLTSDDRSSKWPSELWRWEEGKVSAELLSTMDEMQRALLAPEPSDEDCTPEAGVEAEGL